MAKQTQFDLATLSSVKHGLDEALRVVSARLDQYLDDPAGNASALEQARTELHRVMGVFKMIHLDGLTAYCAEIMRVIAELVATPSLASPLYRSVLQSALTGLNRYLDTLMMGADNATLRLFLKYETMQHLRGLEMSFEQDLFFPNLSVPLPDSVLNIPRPADVPSRIKSAHSQYQRGLMLLWGKDDEAAALPMMQEALDTILSCAEQDDSRAFWWIANGLLDCLRLEGVPLELNVRKLLVRIDRRVRATIKQNPGDVQLALNEMLFLIGRSPVTSERIGQIRQHYALECYLPDIVAAASPEEKKSLEALQERLQDAEDDWEQCVAGDKDACARFVGYVEKVARKSDTLERHSPPNLTRKIKALSEYLRDPDYARLIGEDVAMALLLWHSGMENNAMLAARFQEQAKVLYERIDAAISHQPEDVNRIAELIGVYSQAEHGAVTASLAKEMLQNLEQVEQGLHEFFEDDSKRDGLAGLQGLLVQIHGGLRILSLETADLLLQEIQLCIRPYEQEGVTLKSVDSYALAGAVSALQVYLQQLMHGRHDQTAALVTAAAELSALRQRASNSSAEAGQAPAEFGQLAADIQRPLDEDSELLEIFLEEANEVLGIMRVNVEISQMHPDNPEPLIILRRGFHTLKGSGRMVGLTDLGEVAWAAERAMNKWLQFKRPATPGLWYFMQSAVQAFSGWITELEKQSWVSIKADELIALAQQIANGIDPEVAALLAVGEEIESKAPALLLEEPDSLLIGDIALSPTLFSIASEEASQNVLSMHRHLEAMRISHPPLVEFDFMRAAHTLAGVCRNTGFNAVVQLSAALEGWLQAHLDGTVSPSDKQLQMLYQVVGALDEMVRSIRSRQMPQARDEMVRLVLGDKDKVISDSEASVRQSLVDEVTPAVAEAAVTPAADETVVTPAVDEVAAIVPAEVRPALAAKEHKAILQDDVDAQLLPVFLEEADELCPKTGSCMRILRATPEDAASLQLLNRLLHTLKGSARMTGAMRIGEIVHTMEGRLQEGKAAGVWDALERDFDQMNILLEELRSSKPVIGIESEVVEEDRSIAKPALHIGAERAHSVLRVRSDVVDRLVNQAGEISVARSRMETELRAFKEGLLELSGSVTRLRKQLREVEIQAESQIQARVSLANEDNEQFDPLEFDRYTRLQELTRFMNESVHDVQTVQQSLLKNFDETSSALFVQSRLNRELQQSLMNVRMVPFGSMSERLYRIVRQTGKELNKRANLELTGTGVELDRSVLERMAAPFEHLLRNAMAHGLEAETLRIRAGKDALGEIRLSLRQENNEVVFEFSDDGRGLDFAGLREQAISKGLVDAADATISDEQLAQLIFTSGLSTAQEVTEVAGRGIGMDVVRSEISGLGGRIDVSSSAGQGTNFTIHLPLTLAVTQVLMVRAGEATYAIPSNMVEQVRQVKPTELAAVYAAHKVEWQDRVYPFHYLPLLLGIEEHAPQSHPHNPLILLRSGEQRIALHVDELLGNQEAVVKNIGPQLARMPGIAGATVLGSGEVVLILNPVQMSQRIVLSVQKIQKAAPVVLRVKPLVMIVDDSLTVRKITSRLLNRAGYQVVTAKDGVDALEQLTEITPDVMLLDIEMPRMDGFELTRLLRRDEKTRDLPIIMITSRTADKHRDFALQLGVNGYLGKPYQEQELLERIAGFIAKAV